MKTNEIKHIINGMLIGCMMSTVAVGQSVYKYVKLRVSGNGSSDETVVRFVPGAKQGYDAFDAYKLPNDYPHPNISFIADSYDFVINSVPLLDYDMEIPVRLLVGISGQYMIEIIDEYAAPSGAGIALEDKTAGNWVNLRERSYYSFSINDTTTEPRFALHLYTYTRVSKHHISCFGSGDGFATAHGAGKGPWNYYWTSSGGTVLRTILNSHSSDILNILSGGGYRVTIQDKSGLFQSCSDSLFIAEPQPLNASAYMHHVACKNGNEGHINMIIIGGTAPYQFLWSTGDSTQNIANLAAGQYILTTTDNNGCSVSDSVKIYEHDSIIAGFITDGDTAYLSDGGVEHFSSTSSGGTSLYTWDFGDGSPQAVGADVFHTYISKGIYMVKLVASNGLCGDTAFRKIYVLNGPSAVRDHEAEKEFVEIKATQRATNLEIAIIVEAPMKGIVRVMDISGRVIFKEEKIWKEKESPIEISSEMLSQGIWLAQFSSERFSQIRKIAVMPTDGIR